MLDVMLEVAVCVAIILQIKGILDVSVYPSLETSKNGIILTLKIVLGSPSADHSCCAACYIGWVCGEWLNWLDVVEVCLGCEPRRT